MFALGLKYHTGRYILQQNAAIAAGTLSGLPINLKVLGLGDGLTVSFAHLTKAPLPDDLPQDPLSQYPGYIQYSASNP